MLGEKADLSGGNSMKIIGREFSLCLKGFCTSYKQRTDCPFFWNTISKMFVQCTVLEDRDKISLEQREGLEDGDGGTFQRRAPLFAFQFNIWGKAYTILMPTVEHSDCISAEFLFYNTLTMYVYRCHLDLLTLFYGNYYL